MREALKRGKAWRDKDGDGDENDFVIPIDLDRHL